MDQRGYGDYPQVRTLNFWLVAGDLVAVHAMLPMIYDYGRRSGCACAEFVGRKGWTRVMARDGWKVADTVSMTREL